MSTPASESCSWPICHPLCEIVKLISAIETTNMFWQFHSPCNGRASSTGSPPTEPNWNYTWCYTHAITNNLLSQYFKPVVQQSFCSWLWTRLLLTQIKGFAYILLGDSSLVCLAWSYRFPQHICVFPDSLCTVPTLMLVCMWFKRVLDKQYKRHSCLLAESVWLVLFPAQLSAGACGMTFYSVSCSSSALGCTPSRLQRK